MLAEWSLKIERKKKDLKSRNKGKEEHRHSQQIKLNNFTVSFLDMRKEVLHPISIAIKVKLVFFNKANQNILIFMLCM